MSAEEFTQNWNFLCKLQSLDAIKPNYPDNTLLNITKDEDFTDEDELEQQPQNNYKQKQIRLCRHKLRG
jgi:hypothetical protein